MSKKSFLDGNIIDKLANSVTAVVINIREVSPSKLGAFFNNGTFIGSSETYEELERMVVEYMRAINPDCLLEIRDGRGE